MKVEIILGQYINLHIGWRIAGIVRLPKIHGSDQISCADINQMDWHPNSTKKHIGIQINPPTAAAAPTVFHRRHMNTANCRQIVRILDT